MIGGKVKCSPASVHGWYWDVGKVLVPSGGFAGFAVG